MWDEAGARYTAYMNTVRAHMPAGLKHIDDSYYLHDAYVQGMGQKDRIFLIVLQLDTAPRSMLTFQYDLVGEPVIIRDDLPARLRSLDDQVDWQYDEIEMVPGNPPTWIQSTLFSNGWEVRLHFHDVRVQEFQALIPSPCPAGRACPLAPSA